MVKKDVAHVQPRHVAVSIPFCLEPPPDSAADSFDKKVMVCLVSSRKHEGRFVLPKGGVEKGEASRDSAIRELYEEAGLVPSSNPPTLPLSFYSTSSSPLGDHKPHSKSPSQDPKSPVFVPRALYSSHALYVQRGQEDQELPDWPEKHERHRQWFELDEAEKRLEWRKDVHKLLEDWSSGLKSS